MFAGATVNSVPAVSLNHSNNNILSSSNLNLSTDGLNANHNGNHQPINSQPQNNHHNHQNHHHHHHNHQSTSHQQQQQQHLIQQLNDIYLHPLGLQQTITSVRNLFKLIGNSI